ESPDSTHESLLPSHSKREQWTNIRWAPAPGDMSAPAWERRTLVRIDPEEEGYGPCDRLLLCCSNLEAVYATDGLQRGRRNPFYCRNQQAAQGPRSPHYIL